MMNTTLVMMALFATPTAAAFAGECDYPTYEVEEWTGLEIKVQVLDWAHLYVSQDGKAKAYESGGVGTGIPPRWSSPANTGGAEWCFTGMYSGAKICPH